jgi:cation transport ATPase
VSHGCIGVYYEAVAVTISLTLPGEILELRARSQATRCIPLAAGLLYPFTGQLLSPMAAALAMSLRSVSVITNALRMRGSVK